MRIGNVGNARPIYYDRNPLQVPLLYGVNGVAPHVYTVRWSYTVPASRSAFIEYALAQVYRDSQFFPPGNVVVTIFLKFQGVTGPDLVYLHQQNGIKGILLTGTLTLQMLLKAGDGISAATIDDSTGGTNAYDVSAKLIEFDA